MKLRNLILIAMLLTSVARIGAQGKMRVIIDNDFAGDPDGLFALAQLVQSPSVDVKAIIGSHLHSSENWTAKGKPSATTAVSNVNHLLALMGQSGKHTVCEGSNSALADTLTPIRNKATDAIIREARASRPGDPLYVLCGGGLTEIASAWMLAPEISKNIVVVWIGGGEYPGFTAPPGVRGGEYNTTIDVKAAQVVFNRSDLTLWQIPRNAYRQCLTSYAVLHSRMPKGNKATDYLLSLLDRYISPGRKSECYVLGDSPLVLMSALQSNWERDACSSYYEWRDCPTVNDKGFYSFGASRRKVKVFDRIDTYLMFEDMFAKFR